jgi:hypothetical protein
VKLFEDFFAVDKADFNEVKGLLEYGLEALFNKEAGEAGDWTGCFGRRTVVLIHLVLWVVGSKGFQSRTERVNLLGNQGDWLSVGHLP